MDLFSEEYLMHHGIVGQKWGVRRGPPYPIEDTVLRKGTRLNSTTGVTVNPETYRNRPAPMYTYNPEDDWDKKVYEGPFTMYNILYRGAKFAAVFQYEVISDLKMPTKKERIQEFKDLFNDPKDRKNVINELNTVRKRLVEHKIGNETEQEQYRKFDPSKIKTEEDWNTAYSIFNHAMEAAHAYKSTAAYMERMKSKYDAMVDDNNQGVYNNAHDPVIIFNAQKALKTVGDVPVRYLTAAEITQNRNDVAAELTKEGKRVKL